jgi:tryptophan synthase alpha chain
LSPLEARLRALRKRDQAGLVPFVTAGHLGLAGTVPLLEALARGGAAAIELGIPFSDPLADGPAIQRTSEVALSHGAGAAHALEAAARFHERQDTPLVIMTYANPVLAYGAERFGREAAAAGVSGVIVSDLPPEERADVWEALATSGLDTILLVAPTTSVERRAELARRSRGFVYCLSRTGITGESARAFAGELAAIVASVRAVTDVPVGVGFGVSDAARAAQVGRIADAVIVGAALCERVEKARERGLSAATGEAERFVSELSVAAANARKS